jgi:probable HAF family extracellular repeat protein
MDGQHAFLWTKEMGLQDLGTLPGGNISQAYGSNDKDEIVGYSFTNEGTAHAFFWLPPAGPMQDLGTLPGGTTSGVSAINSMGVIVGSSDYQNSAGSSIAVMWSPDGTIQALPILQGATSSNALSNNDGNDIVGASILAVHVFHATLWPSTKGGVQDLGTLTGGSKSYAGYINNHGVIIGGSDSAKHPGVIACALWDAHLKIHALGSLKAGNTCGLSQINDLGRAVGGSNVASGASHAVFWSKQTGLRDLNKSIPKNSGWVLAGAISINRAGQIVGPGTFNGENHGFLLTPVK